MLFSFFSGMETFKETNIQRLMLQKLNVIIFNIAKWRRSEGSAVRFQGYFSKRVGSNNRSPVARAKFPLPPQATSSPCDNTSEYTRQ